MNIKRCNAIVVEENGTREIFCEEDIVCVEYWDGPPESIKPRLKNPKCLKVTGRVKGLRNGVTWSDWDSVVYGNVLTLDISTEYRENKIEINLDKIKSIERTTD